MNRQKKEQLKKAGLRHQEEEQRRIRAENNLYKLLLAIMLYKANDGIGDEWRVVFSPRTIAFGKKLTLKIDAGKQALTLGDIQTMAAANLKIEVAPLMMPDDLEKLLPPDYLKKTFVASARFAEAPKPAEQIKAVEEHLPPVVSDTPGFLVITDVAPKEGDPGAGVAYGAKIVFDAVAEAQEAAMLERIIQNEKPIKIVSDKPGVIATDAEPESEVKSGGIKFRGKMILCSSCGSFHAIDAAHTCE